MSARMPVEVMGFRKEEDIFEDHQAVEPVTYQDGTVELKAELWGGYTVYLRFSLAELVRLALAAKRQE